MHTTASEGQDEPRQWWKALVAIGVLRGFFFLNFFIRECAVSSWIAFRDGKSIVVVSVVRDLPMEWNHRWQDNAARKERIPEQKWKK
mmetsp:Transcript_21835/g.60671  ORF Transcript_21835/g.60671 Transcript_21835/m.60671 type:complete len:87 (+) Transcript_21835:1479-1739(+)